MAETAQKAFGLLSFPFAGIALGLAQYPRPDVEILHTAGGRSLFPVCCGLLSTCFLIARPAAIAEGSRAVNALWNISHLLNVTTQAIVIREVRQTPLGYLPWNHPVSQEHSDDHHVQRAASWLAKNAPEELETLFPADQQSELAEPDTE